MHASCSHYSEWFEVCDIGSKDLVNRSCRSLVSHRISVGINIQFYESTGGGEGSGIGIP